MSNPEVTLIAPAVRTSWWMELYEAFEKTNDTKMQFIFVGHIIPEYTLPDNFKYVYCQGTAAYCAQLGFDMVETEYVMNIADDYDPRPEHMSKNIIDKCLQEHRRVEALGVEHFFVGPSFKLGPEDKFSEVIPLLYSNGDHTSPVLTLSPLTKISTQRHVGGIDKSFEGLYWDTDINMRLYEIGGHSKVMGLKYIDELKKWVPNKESDEYIFFTERDNNECIATMKQIHSNTLSLRNRSRDHNRFRSLWNPANLKGITLPDGRHYFEKDSVNMRKQEFLPYGVGEVKEG